MSKIIVDAFVGDNAPLSVIQGCADAIKEYGVEITLCGNEEIIKNVAKENNISLEGMSIIHTEEVFDMHTDPSEIIKSGKNTSMAVGLSALANGEGDGFVSAGSTGALLVGATFIVKRIKGIKRPAIATTVPAPDGLFLLLDSGANVECRPEMLYSFAVMGSTYMQKVVGIENPRIGLLNVGVEDTKGDTLRLETYQLLRNSEMNFVGNIEAREVPNGACDVLVCDGFSGNVVLKLFEGLAKSFFKLLKRTFLSGLKNKIGAALLKKDVYAIKKSLDASEQGGAPLLGVTKPVIKAHGSSDAKAIKNAIRQAFTFADSGAIDIMTENFAKKES